MITNDRRRQRSSGTRSALQAAASALFAERGYEGTTLDAIAERAGVNKALIRYHFGAKQGLYSAILRLGIDAGRELFEPLRDSALAPAQRFKAYVRALCEFGFQNREFVFILVREEMTGGRHIEADVMQDFAQFFLIDREILKVGMEQGVFRSVDPHAMHLSLVGSLVFFLLSEPLRASRQDVPAADVAREDYARHVEQLFMRGLESAPQ
jgi:AcrR family transcriptional regulator